MKYYTTNFLIYADQDNGEFFDSVIYITGCVIFFAALLRFSPQNNFFNTFDIFLTSVMMAVSSRNCDRILHHDFLPQCFISQMPKCLI